MAKKAPANAAKRTKASKSRSPSKAERERTLEAFRGSLMARTDEAVARERGRDVPEWKPAVGIPPGHVMAARWCTMIDALHTIGRALYKNAWTPSILDDNPTFPFENSTMPIVSRRIAWSHRPDDPSWDKAFAAFAMLLEALAEGLVQAVAEAINGGTVPYEYENAQPKFVGIRERVPIKALHWRRDEFVMAPGLVRAWWSLGPDTKPQARWLVLVDRETLANFVERYGDALTVEAATDATAQRGRKRKVPLEDVRAFIVPLWESGVVGPDMKSVSYAIAEHCDVPLGTADHWRLELGIKEGVTPGTRKRSTEE